MQVSAASLAAGNNSNEDWVSTSSTLIVMLDGATVRTETGCVHGVTWFTQTLGLALQTLAADPGVPLPAVLRSAIEVTASEHPECDLKHPGTPAAAVAIARIKGGDIEYLSLGDAAIVLDSKDGVSVISDNRVDATAAQERADANRYLIGSAEKQAALLAMKHAELAARNIPGGYWVAASDPAASAQALTGAVPIAGLRRMAVLTDGAARLVTLFETATWSGLLDILEHQGPKAVILRTRDAENSDPEGRRWSRNKRHDDATVAYAYFQPPLGHR